MAGGGSRRDESVVINSTNVFAALGSLKKKKKPSEKGSSKGKSGGGSGSAKKSSEKEPVKEVFWAPTPLTKKSWADVDDDDDDDYYAVTAPPQSVWGASAAADDNDPAAAKESEHEHEPESEPALEVRTSPSLPLFQLIFFVDYFVILLCMWLLCYDVDVCLFMFC